MINVQLTSLAGVLLLKPDSFNDHRGHYVELYNKKIYQNNVTEIEFVQDDISHSIKYVLRGIHGDSKTWKLISCLDGEIYLIVVNCARQAPQFGLRQAFSLSGGNHHQVLVPPNYGVGHMVMSDSAIFWYKQSTYYNRESQFTYKWNDPELNLWWPYYHPILSERDGGTK